jgi:predicted RNA-binding protein
MMEKGTKIYFSNLLVLKEVSVCDLKAYVLNNDKEELLLESVNHVRSEGGEVVLRNLFGEEKRVRGEVREVSLVKNRVIVIPR